MRERKGVKQLKSSGDFTVNSDGENRVIVEEEIGVEEIFFFGSKTVLNS